MVNIDTGHMRFDPMPTPELLDDFYANSFTRSASAPSPESEFTDGLLNVAEGVILHIRQIDPMNLMPAKWNVFDVGCGYGGFVWAMQKLGMNAWGNELNPTWVQEANPHCNQNLFFGEFSEVQHLIEKKYDLIFISHTLEHLPDPASLLRDAKKSLAENGLIYINVPNSRSNRFRENGRRSGIDYGNFPMHINFFTPSSMRHIARKNGLKVVQLRTRPFDEIIEIAHSDDVERFDKELMGGELFTLLSHDTNSAFIVDQELDKKIQNSSSHIPSFYMSLNIQAKSKLFHDYRDVKVKLKRIIKLTFRIFR
jgi:SAM-dependent methyltransferase